MVGGDVIRAFLEKFLSVPEAKGSATG